MKNSKIRFSDRVKNYVKYRPHYPKEILHILEEKIKLIPQWIIADIGSGTGISSELFVENGNTVFGVEPNKNMRSAAKEYYSQKNNFISINGSAENTTLKDNEVDVIITGQAFHWFNINEAKDEFIRISKEGSYTVIFWNQRKTGDSPFQQEYELFLHKYCKEYDKTTQKNITSAQFCKFYGSKQYSLVKLNNLQKFDFEGLKGRLQSSSYSPTINDPVYPEMINSLQQIFKNHEVNNQIIFEYDTEIYYGKII